MSSFSCLNMKILSTSRFLFKSLIYIFTAVVAIYSNPLFAEIENGVLFYASMENGERATMASGSSLPVASIGTPVNGVAGKGLAVGNKPLKYYAAGNIDIKQGTISFWYKPAWTPDEAFSSSRILFRVEHICGSYTPQSKKLFFMTGRNVPNKGFDWDYSVYWAGIKNWDTSKWYHLTFCWNAETQTKSIYVNGKKVKEGSNGFFPDKMGHALIQFGINAPGLYDEILIWNRMLTEDEIISLVSEPKKTALKLSDISNITAKKAEKNQLKWIIKKVLPVKTIVSPGETFMAEAVAHNLCDIPFNEEVCFTLRDMDLADCGSRTLNLNIPPHSKKELKLPFSINRKGVFKVEAQYSSKKWNDLVDIASFACWPPSLPPAQDSFFGNHVSSFLDGIYLEQAARLGQNWMRNHNMLQTTWWVRVEPASGDWAWDDEAVIPLLQKYKMPVLGQIFTTPYWAADPPVKKTRRGFVEYGRPQIDKFEDYVFKTVSKYKSYIKYWEIWNEPEVSLFWNGSPEQFARLVDVAVKAIRRADPSAKVMAAGFTSTYWNWQTHFAQAGGLKNLDIVSAHFYLGDYKPEIFLKNVKTKIAHFRAMWKTHGGDKPLILWSTEGGIGDSTYLRGIDFPRLPRREQRPPLNYIMGAVRTVQQEVILMSQGIKKHFHYMQTPVSESKYLHNLSTIDFNNVPRPKLIALVNLQVQLDYTDFRHMIYRKEPGFWAFVFQNKNSDGSVAVLWCGDRGQLELQCKWPGNKTGMSDIMGNKMDMDLTKLYLTERPIYICSNATSNQLAEALGQAKIKMVKHPETHTETTVADNPDIPELPDYSSPDENPTGIFTVNLRPFCNMGLADDTPGDGKGGWADEGGLNDMRDLKTGKQKFYGVTFDLINPRENSQRSIITLQGKRLTQSLPAEIRDIPVNRKARALYFLHTAAQGVPGGDIGEYNIIYSDGTKEKIVMNIPHNINNWWTGFSSEEQSKPIAVRVFNTRTGNPAWRYIRVFEWQNPKMNVPIKSIDIKSYCGEQTPIVLAISGVTSLVN